MNPLDKLEYFYYKIIPYEWRPMRIWKRLKCRFWTKHTTYTPRYLPKNSWVDKDIVLEHMCFEILSKFVEYECGPKCFVDWYADCPCNKIIMDDGSEKFIMDELKELYDWWHKDYIPRYKNDEFDINDPDVRMELEEKLVRLIRIRWAMWT